MNRSIAVPTTGRTDLVFAPAGAAMLRATARPVLDPDAQWPDPSDTGACRTWLNEQWTGPLRAGIEHSSPPLARSLNTISSGGGDPRAVRSATLSMARYLLRATGRPAPFGDWAGVAPATVGAAARVDWGTQHRVFLRADTAWLDQVITGLEARPGLIERLRVQRNNLAVWRGGGIEVQRGGGRVRIGRTPALETAWAATEHPVRAVDVAGDLAADADRSRAALGMLCRLVGYGVLVSELRAPRTDPDPLGHLVARLENAGVEEEAAPLRAVWEQMGPAHGERAAVRERMQAIAPAPRSALAVDLRLDCAVEIPAGVTEEAARAAGVLARAARPTGPHRRAWVEYHRRFLARYGVAAVVPLADVVHPDTGLGYPPFPEDSAEREVLDRDRRMAEFAHEALHGSGELDADEIVDALDSGGAGPPHAEVAVTVHAPTAEAVEDGAFRMVLRPARAVGVMTARLARLCAGMPRVYCDLAGAVAGAAQVSFPGLFPAGDNVTQTGQHTNQVISLGEHRDPGPGIIGPDDIGVWADSQRLHLVRRSTGETLDPTVLHALDLPKQAPQLARFLGEVSAGFERPWTAWDWGPCAAALPRLPRVRSGRTILARASWKADAASVARAGGLDAWRRRWHCPPVVELRHHDRSLRLDLRTTLHREILAAHLERHQEAQLTEAPEQDAFGWIGGHAHEIVIPLRAAEPRPAPGQSPRAEHQPAALGALPRWLSVRLHTHPDRHTDIIAATRRLRQQTGALVWCLRYRTPDQTPHVRVRVGVGAAGYGARLEQVHAWIGELDAAGLVADVAVDRYRPEVGRYGSGAAMEAVEEMFAADSSAVAEQIAAMGDVAAEVVCAVGMVAIARGLLGPEEGMRWLCGLQVDRADLDRAHVDEVRRLTAHMGAGPPAEWPESVRTPWEQRAAALDRYREAAEGWSDYVGWSILHLHHNRAVSIDRASEARCVRMAALAARSILAR